MQPAEERRGVLGTWVRVVTAPRSFFSPGQPPPSGTSPLVFYLAVHGVNALGTAAVMSHELGSVAGAVPALLMLVARLFELYVIGSILGLGARWLGGNGSPESGRSVYAYAAAPYVFAFVPYVGWLAVVAWLVVLVIGIARYHALSYGRAVIATSLPVFAPVLLTVPLALLLRLFVLEAFKIPSTSMAPALVPGDHVFVNKLAYGAFTKTLPPRGAAIVFRYPPAPDTSYVKRVVGLPGDTVRVEGPRLFVNGWGVPTCRLGPIPAPERPGETLDASVESLEGAAYVVLHDDRYFMNGEWRVAPGELFVLGDNRENAADSRAWNGGKGGGVPLDHVTGPVGILWWPSAERRSKKDLFHDVATLTAPAGIDAAAQAAFARCAAHRPSALRATPPPPAGTSARRDF
jgi:signal peptidase I